MESVPHFDRNPHLLHQFTGGDDGAAPYAGLIMDTAGNLYSTTVTGGSSFLGVVFELEPTGKEIVLHPFTGIDGAYPQAPLIPGQASNFFGTTYNGGSSTTCTGGCGTVFEQHILGRETVFYNFKGKPDGGNAFAGLIRDTAGNFYGTTYDGGTANSGTVYMMDQSGKETILYNFTGRADGRNPVAGLIRDRSDNLYGATANGGSFANCSNGCGVVFELDTAGKYTVLHKFTGQPDGTHPNGGLAWDPVGNIYGTSKQGGSSTGCGSVGCGVIFNLNRAGETVIYSFTGGADGATPLGGLISDATGNLYGTTAYGGSSTACVSGCGVVFKLVP
jgi:uncharacterized repeat protein (TIGR03803 family)